MKQSYNSFSACGWRYNSGSSKNIIVFPIILVSIFLDSVANALNNSNNKDLYKPLLTYSAVKVSDKFFISFNTNFSSIFLFFNIFKKEVIKYSACSFSAKGGIKRMGILETIFIYVL